jgi:hypothetical protein
VVRQERRLRVTSPEKGSKRGQRTAEWADAEVAADRVPAYRPSHQLELLPPAAAVRRVCGFSAAAGFGWLPPEQQGERDLLCAAGNVLLAEGLESGAQRRLSRLPRDVTALAATTDGRLAAVAVQPAAAAGSTADIHLVALSGAAEPGAVLSHHSFAVQVCSDRPAACHAAVPQRRAGFERLLPACCPRNPTILCAGPGLQPRWQPARLARPLRR